MFNCLFIMHLIIIAASTGAWITGWRNMNHCCLLLGNEITFITRKLCYRKDDRAMRPTYGCPENFRDSLTTSTATIPNIFMGFCSG